MTRTSPLDPAGLALPLVRTPRTRRYVYALSRELEASQRCCANSPKIADIQAQIDSTVDIMHQNITKVAERGERLDALQDKTGECITMLEGSTRPLAGANDTDNLAVSAQGFRRGASRVRKQMWCVWRFGSLKRGAFTDSLRWKDMKMRVIIAIGICVLIVIIVVPIVKA